MAVIYKTLEEIPSEHTRAVIRTAAKVFCNGDIQAALDAYNAAAPVQDACARAAEEAAARHTARATGVSLRLPNQDQ